MNRQVYDDEKKTLNFANLKATDSKQNSHIYLPKSAKMKLETEIQMRNEKLMEVARASPLWDGRVVVLQVSDATRDNTVELRALLSARSAPAAWDLRCDVREKLIAYLQEEYPGSLPRQRQEFVSRNEPDQAPLSPHTMVSHHRAG